MGTKTKGENKMRKHNQTIKKQDIIVLGHITHSQRMNCTWAIIAQDGDVDKLVGLFMDPTEAAFAAESLGCTRIINLHRHETRTKRNHCQIGD